MRKAKSMSEENMITEDLGRFVKSMDFMRIGQAIVHGQWQSAYMTLRRLEALSKECGCQKEFELPIRGLRDAIQHKNTEQAKQLLSILVAKRAEIYNNAR